MSLNVQIRSLGGCYEQTKGQRADLVEGLPLMGPTNEVELTAVAKEFNVVSHLILLHLLTGLC